LTGHSVEVFILALLPPEIWIYKGEFRTQSFIDRDVFSHLLPLSLVSVLVIFAICIKCLMMAFESNLAGLDFTLALTALPFLHPSKDMMA
jgi:hypothetical protein